MKHKTNIILLLILLLLPISVVATEKKTDNTSRPLFTALELQLGQAHWIETPLSQLSYKGTDLAIGIEMMRAFKGESRWVQQHQLRYNYGRGKIAISGVGGSSYHLASYTFAMMHHSTVAPRLRIYYGADIALSGGIVTNAHGGNNPLTIKTDLSLGATVMAVYDFNIVRLPVTARYQLSLPVVGTFSQIEYGELTRHPFQGMQWGTWNNRFDMKNRIHFDLHFSSWALRLGYHNDIITHYATGNRYQLVTHNFVLGFAGDLMRWSKKNEGKTIKRALYIH